MITQSQIARRARREFLGRAGMTGRAREAIGAQPFPGGVGPNAKGDDTQIVITAMRSTTRTPARRSRPRDAAPGTLVARAAQRRGRTRQHRRPLGWLVGQGYDAHGTRLRYGPEVDPGTPERRAQRRADAAVAKAERASAKRSRIERERAGV